MRTHKRSQIQFIFIIIKILSLNIDYSILNRCLPIHNCRDLFIATNLIGKGYAKFGFKMFLIDVK